MARTCNRACTIVSLKKDMYGETIGGVLQDSAAGTLHRFHLHAVRNVGPGCAKSSIAVNDSMFWAPVSCNGNTPCGSATDLEP
jgi:hypothetical protein